MLLPRRTKAFVDAFGCRYWRDTRCFVLCFPSATTTTTRSITTWTKVPLSFHNNNSNTTVLTIPEQYSAAPTTSSRSNGTTSSMDPSGRRLWPTALPLLEYVHQDIQTKMTHHNQNNNISIRILELGAGCGLVGMGLATLLPPSQLHHVHLTDQDTGWIHKTWTENQSQLLECPISIQTLKWGEDIKEDILKVLRQESTNNNTTTTYLIGSDVLYNSATHSDLWKTISQLSKAAMGSQHPDESEESSSSLSLSSSNNVVQIILVDPIRTQNQGGAGYDDGDEDRYSKNTSTTTDLFYQSILDNTGTTSDDNFWKNDQVVTTIKVMKHSFLESEKMKKNENNHNRNEETNKKMYSILHMTITSR